MSLVPRHAGTLQQGHDLFGARLATTAVSSGQVDRCAARVVYGVGFGAVVAEVADHIEALLNFRSLGNLAALAHPSYDHFLPLLYSLGVAGADASVRTFCEGFQWPGISMRSFVLA